ncbi:MAG: hypothetical protein IKK27_08540 [Alistipes sp.]|nr:hypothetical protein [Alistipes sp.]
MKRFLFCLMAMVAIVGCTDEGPDDGGSTGGGSTQPQAAITLTTTALNFATEGGSQNVTFTSSGEWTAQVLNDRANDWCKLTPASGAAGNGQITVTAAANATTDERSASIILKSGTVQKTIKVTQKQKDALTVTASKFEVAFEGGTVAIEVKANIDFSYAVDGASQSWIKYQTTRAMKTSTLVFDIAENDSRDKRQGTVTISSGALKEVVTIYQEDAKPTIVISKSEYVIGSEGGSVAVEVKSNVDVSVELPSDVEWVSESTTRAMSTNTYYFDVAENTGYDQRSATIVFTNKADNLTEEVTITQTQKDAIVLAKDNYVVDSEGDVIVIEVGHNVDFDVEIADSWITQDQTRTFVNDVLTFTVAKNTGYDNREGTIKFTSKDKSIIQTAKVYQAQSDALIVSKKDIVIGDEGGIVDLVIQSNVEFTVSDPDVSWVHSVATRALTTTTLQYEVDANTSYDQRVATLIVTNTKTKATEEVTITQTQKDAIVLAKSEYEIGVDGGALDFEIQTNVDVTVNTSATWIKQVTTRALESKMLFFDIAANSAEEDREGKITISGGDVTQTVTIKQKGTSEILEMEREALIAIYNALDGDNWANNTNWCSDKPVSQWYGVEIDSTSSVISLCIEGNRNKLGERTSFPVELENLRNLSRLELNYTNVDSFPEQFASSLNIKEFISASNLYLTLSELKPIYDGAGELEVFSVIIHSQHYEFSDQYKTPQPIPLELFKNKNLRDLGLSGCNLSGTIPDEIGTLTELRNLSLYNLWDTYLTGEIPSSIGNLKNLLGITLFNLNLTGGIPEELYTLTQLTDLAIDCCYIGGQLSSNIQNLKKLRSLNLRSCNLEGNLPEELAILMDGDLEDCMLLNNRLTGDIPNKIKNHSKWAKIWASVVFNNQFNLTIDDVPTPVFDTNDVWGNRIVSDEVYKKNSYTIIYGYDVAVFPYMSNAIYPCHEMHKLYNAYNKFGVDIVMINDLAWDEEVREFIKNNNIPWTTICFQPFGMTSIPYIVIVDSMGKVAYTTILTNPLFDDVKAFFEEKFPNAYYTSTDYSQDGVVTTLQTATKGEGIDLVLMGDAYSDRQIADGTYKTDMEYIYNNLFAEEPYKSFKDHFNVHYVNVVSATEGYDYGNTALSGYFGNGTQVGGNDGAVFNYALNAISEEEMDEALLIVAMNSNNYAGTCYMYYPQTSLGYGNGVSVAYFPKGGDQTTFAQLLHHEACGHGFAKLADEYAYEEMGAVSSDYVSQIQAQQTDWGWWKNVDFTSDISAVRWAEFISDSRYANEKLGAYEGGLTYWTGVWRPTENSIMRYNTGGFNAPSREAIYYRINKLAYGDEWTYDYETFVEYDAINRTTTTTTQSVPMIYKPTAPPVVMQKNWRDELR